MEYVEENVSLLLILLLTTATFFSVSSVAMIGQLLHKSNRKIDKDIKRIRKELEVEYTDLLDKELKIETEDYKESLLLYINKIKELKRDNDRLRSEYNI